MSEVFSGVEGKRFMGALARGRAALRAFEKTDGEMGYSMRHPDWKKFVTAYQRAQSLARFFAGASCAVELDRLWKMGQEATARRDDRIHHEREAELNRLDAVILAGKRQRAANEGW